MFSYFIKTTLTSKVSQLEHIFIILSTTHNFISRDENNITAVFRWNKPRYLNGEIIKYEVYCWYDKNGSRNPFCGKEQVLPHQLQYVIENAPQNVTFYFQVRFKTLSLYTLKIFHVFYCFSIHIIFTDKCLYGWRNQSCYRPRISSNRCGISDTKIGHIESRIDKNCRFRHRELFCMY